jgi:hypothetical protein
MRPKKHKTTERSVPGAAGPDHQSEARADSTGRQDRLALDRRRRLCPCQTVQAAPAAVAHPALPARSDHPRHPPQGRRSGCVRKGVRTPASRTTQIRSQQQRQHGWKLYSFHAPEVECSGKGKASAPYEFGVKASRRIFISGQKRDVFGVIRRALRRRPAIEPIIGHLEVEGHVRRCYLKGRAGDAANVVLSAVGHNFRRVRAWLRELLCLFLFPLWRALAIPAPLKLGFLTDDQTMRGSPTRNRAFACGCFRRLRYAGDGDMAAAATSLSRDLRSWSCGSGSIPIVDKMCSQR